MTTATDPRLVASLKIISRGASLFVIVLAGLVLVGWVFDVATLKSIMPGYVTMKVNTALGLLLAGIFLSLRWKEQVDDRIWYATQACAGLLVLIGLLSLIENLWGVDLGIDNLLIQDKATLLGTASPGRMAISNSSNFFMLGLALLFLDTRSRIGVWTVQVLILIVGLVALVGLIGYTYQVSSFYSIARFTRLAIHTVVGTLLLCTAYLAARPDRGVTAVLTSRNAGGVMARRVLPATILIPFLLGWLRVKGQQADLFDPDLGISLVVVACIVIFSTLIWWNAASLNLTDQERRRAEETSKTLQGEMQRQSLDRAQQLEAANKTILEAVGRLAASSAAILATTRQQAAGAQEQAAAVTQTMTTVEEVTLTSDQAAQRARRVGETVQRTLEIGKAGRKAVEDSIAAMNEVKGQVATTAENILMLAEQAQAIGEIIASVNDIAEQTNLLALNAAIEASRAGEHGKGFAVVAREVKALAEQSKKATMQVRQILGVIQKATNSAVLSTEQVTTGVAGAIRVGVQSGGAIKSLADTLDQAAQATVQIVASAGQQATGMTQINQAMRNIEEVARQNLSATQKAEQAAQNLNALGIQLRDLGRRDGRADNHEKV